MSKNWIKGVRNRFDPKDGEGYADGSKYFNPHDDLDGDSSRQRLRASFLESADKQIKDYAPSKAAYERLRSQGISEFDCRMFFANLISRMTYHVLKTKKPFDEELFATWLDRLPELPED
jgi:hypothetical protein